MISCSVFSHPSVRLFSTWHSWSRPIVALGPSEGAPEVSAAVVLLAAALTSRHGTIA